jgi:membrane-associated phospholipid phosphatase
MTDVLAGFAQGAGFAIVALIILRLGGFDLHVTKRGRP